MINTIRMGAVALACVCGLAVATPEEAKARLEATVKAMHEVSNISADITHAAQGQFADMMTSGTAKLFAARADRPEGEEPAPLEVRITGSGRLASSKPEMVFDVVRRNGRYEWLAHDQKVLRKRMERQARDEQVRLAKEFAPTEVWTSDPFERAIADTRISLEAPQDVEGVPCEVVKVPQGATSRYVLYYLAKEDHLPRRVESVFSAGGMNGSIITTYSNITTNDGTKSVKDVAIVMPEGYTEEPEPGTVSPGLGVEEIKQAPSVQALPEPGVSKPVLQNATDWELKDAAGNSVKLSDLRGHVVVLDFWGTWCAPCLKAAPELQKLHEDYAERGVKVLGLNFREKHPQKAIDLAKSEGWTYDILLGADQVVRDYRVRIFPTYWVIGFEGEVVHVEDGHKAGTTFDTLRRVIDAYLEDHKGGGETQSAEQ